MKRILLSTVMVTMSVWQSFAKDDLPKNTMELVYRVVWGEARSLPNAEVAAICHVIYNRLPRYKTLRKVVTAPAQFSALNRDDPNREKLLRPGLVHTKGYKRIASVCGDVFAGRALRTLSDPTNPFGIDGLTTHYFHGKKIPYWAEKEYIYKVGHTNFVMMRKDHRVVRQALAPKKNKLQQYTSLLGWEYDPS